ncbi:transcriptional regulator [Listeria monocytogenes]|nr:transcriptional regulator [Listeria monocytogenes]EAC8000874.1 transcriptional regulator [Listeria monocytogenes]EAC8351032.1 transcriptional regulator [Listeria monocytogenes]EAD4096305.1 transcriptional regulator [Listeria monocytogenes]EAD9140636.1 transcriptional regulator [Listeria monocytogenes]
MSRELALKVRVKLVERDWTMTILAKELGRSTVYLSGIINEKKMVPKLKNTLKN